MGNLFGWIEQASSSAPLAINRLIAALWFRERPFLSHRIAHPWIDSRDASFPSDHSSASFAIAFAVICFDPLIGGLFLVAATTIAVGRLFIGAHYPGDVAAGFLVGLVSAVIVTRFARRPVVATVSLVERLTDPVLRPLWL